MSGLELLIAFVGFAATALVVAGMILITPRGEVDLHGEADPQGSNLSRGETSGRRTEPAPGP